MFFWFFSMKTSFGKKVEIFFPNNFWRAFQWCKNFWFMINGPDFKNFDGNGFFEKTLIFISNPLFMSIFVILKIFWVPQGTTKYFFEHFPITGSSCIGRDHFTGLLSSSRKFFNSLIYFFILNRTVKTVLFG